MKTLGFKTLRLSGALAGMVCLSAQAELVVNGGFETGFAGWTVLDQIGSDGSFQEQTGTLTPVNSIPVPAPPQGVVAAMTDAQGPGSHVLYQDIMIPAGFSGNSLQFSLFIGNGADDFFVPNALNTLDFSTPNLSQQARVDIITTTADPFSIAAGDVLKNLYQTNPGDPLNSGGYHQYNFDISDVVQAYQGQTIRLRFAEVDNVNFFNFGVDSVSLPTPNAVPDSFSWAILIPIPLLMLVNSRGRRRQANA